MLWVPQDNKLQYPVAWARVRGELCLPVRHEEQPIPEIEKSVTSPVSDATKLPEISLPPAQINSTQQLSPSAASVAEEKISTLFFRRLKERVISVELWLGLSVGATAHLAMKGIIDAAFAHERVLPTASANNILCLGIGAAIGMIVSAARLLYCNFGIAPGKKTQKFQSRPFIIATLTGMIGGIAGSIFGNIGAVIMKAGILPFSVTAGIILGVPFVVLTEPANLRQQWTKAEWGERALWGAGFGIAGGLAGAMFADLFSAHSVIVAASDHARWALFPSRAEIFYAAAAQAVVPPPIMIQTTNFVSPEDATVYAQALEVARHALPRAN